MASQEMKETQPCSHTHLYREEIVAHFFIRTHAGTALQWRGTAKSGSSGRGGDNDLSAVDRCINVRKYSFA